MRLLDKIEDMIWLGMKTNPPFFEYAAFVWEEFSVMGIYLFRHK